VGVVLGERRGVGGGRATSLRLADQGNRPTWLVDAWTDSASSTNSAWVNEPMPRISSSLARSLAPGRGGGGAVGPRGCECSPRGPHTASYL
jgi:hypothetical protein